MEYIDIFDENDNPIGEKKEKQQAHEDGNFHRTAHVWIINDKNEWLLQKRSANKKTHPNCWDISGAGHIKAGEAIIDGAIRQLKEELGIEITEDQVVSVYNMGDYFMVQTKANYYEASTVILATGVTTAKPYPNEEKLLGKGVSYCATCDAPLYKGKTVAVIATNKEEEPEVTFLKEYAEKVYYFPLYEEAGDLDNIDIRKEKPQDIIGDNKIEKLKTDKNEYDIDGLFILRESVAPKQLVPGLETDGPHVKVNLDMSTNIPGLFACGDIAGLPYQYIKSAGQGNVAALSAVKYLVSPRK